jgi:hypothetical protein
MDLEKKKRRTWRKEGAKRGRRKEQEKEKDDKGKHS